MKLLLTGLFITDDEAAPSKKDALCSLNILTHMGLILHVPPSQLQENKSFPQEKLGICNCMATFTIGYHEYLQ